jgi:hypothetical protein
MPQSKQDFIGGNVIVAAGVSGVFKTYLRPFVVVLALLWSKQVQEA